MEKIKDNELIFESLVNVPLDNIQGFSCGNQLIDNYIKTHYRAEMEHLLGLASTTVVTYRGTVVAFFTALCSTFSVNSDEAINLGITNPSVPAIEVLYFAVCKDYQQKGIGRAILKKLIWEVYEISQKVACRYLFLWSVPDDTTLQFYKSMFFKDMEKTRSDGLQLLRFQIPQDLEEEKY
jgi:GNAT superfamily N-acetyltransferase